MEEENFKKKRLIFLSLVIVLIAGSLYQFFWNQRIKKYGIYIKGTLINSESTKGGILITVRYTYNRISYEVRLGSDLGKSSIGNQYFIQLEPKNPKAIIFYGDKPVPDCILNIDPPILGWKEIPNCP